MNNIVTLILKSWFIQIYVLIVWHKLELSLKISLFGRIKISTFIAQNVAGFPQKFPYRARLDIAWQFVNEILPSSTWVLALILLALKIAF